MVLTSFRTGLRDFFMQPSRELKHITKNPSRVGVGVLKGTLSLVSNSASGIFGFASNLGATVGHTATMLTLDEHFQRLHSEQKASQQRYYDRWKKKGFGHVTLMISRPVHDIVFGVLSAATGVLTEPYRGAKKNGLVGFAKGTAIGVIGVVVKPIVGVADAFSHVMESIHDIAKSVNLLEVKFKPIERYRLPYVFGSNRMLLPFNQVDSRSAQLLLAHPLDKKTKKGDELLLAAEALHVGNGLEHYIVITTMRAVLFRLKVVDGQGFITVNIVWQVRFEKGARVSSSLGNRGHNGSILYISRYSSQKQGDSKEADGFTSNTIPEESPHVKNEQDRHGDYFFPEGEGKCPNADTPKSFYPLGASTAAFRLRTAWPFAAGDGGEVTRFAIEGEFKQRLQLSRIHNAICCFSGDFESIIYEGNHNDRGEGTTTFGPLIFEHPEEGLECLEENVGDDLSSLYSSLEHTPWKCNGLKTSLFSDAMNNSILSGGPSWLVETRARGMFAPPPPPPLPSNVDPIRDPLVSEIISELEHGQRSSESASQEIYAHAHSLRFQKIRQGLAENEHFLRRSQFGVVQNTVTMEEYPNSVGSSKSVGAENLSAHHEQDSFENESQSIETYGSSPLIEDSNDSGFLPHTPIHYPSGFLLENTLQENLPMIDESLPANAQPAIEILSSDGTPNEQRASPSLDERLQRVETLLECLVGCDSSASSISHIARFHMAPTQISQVDNLSAVSSFNHMNASTPSHQSHGGQVEVEVLLKEIDDLKRQLAARNSNASTDSSTELHTETLPDIEAKPRKKIKGHIKKIFKGKQPK